MPVTKLVFYLFSLLTVGSSLMVITSRNTVRSALYLVLAFFSAAGLWMLMEAEFLAITLVLVYVGAVMVLFLFVVMMLDIKIASIKATYTKYLPIAVVAAVGLLLTLVKFVGPHNFGIDQVKAPALHPADYSNITELARVLYTDYVLAFELAAVLLLVAIIAAIALSFRGKQNRRSQRVHQQITTKKADRLKIISMPAESNTQEAN